VHTLRLMLTELVGASHPRFTLAEFMAARRRARQSQWRSGCYRWIAGLSIGRDTAMPFAITIRAGRRGHLREISIGEGTVFGEGVTLNPDARIDIGSRTRIGSDVRIYTTTHRFGAGDRRCLPGAIVRPVHIGSDVVIEDGVIVLPGVSIGNGATITAGATVAQSVDPGAVVAGMPAAELRRGAVDETTDSGVVPTNSAQI
jgi:acetyltransferase-like isoleucine patch superfamily enzyme